VADGRLVPYEPEKAALRRLYELADAGTSLRRIAASLDAERLPSRGDKWHPTTIRRLLARRTGDAAA
jgi:hypothetical protein